MFDYDMLAIVWAKMMRAAMEEILRPFDSGRMEDEYYYKMYDFDE